MRQAFLDALWLKAWENDILIFLLIKHSYFASAISIKHYLKFIQDFCIRYEFDRLTIYFKIKVTRFKKRCILLNIIISHESKTAL